MVCFYRCGSIASRLELLRGGNLHFTKLPRNCWYSFYQHRKNEKLSQPWSRPMVLKTVQFLRRTKILKTLFNNLAWHKMQWCNVLKSYHQKTAKNLFSRETRNLILYIYLVYGKLVIFNPQRPVDFWKLYWNKN